MAQGFSKGEKLIGGAGVKCFINGTPQATTSGVSKDFTVPSGVKRIDVVFDQVYLSGTDELMVQLGDSGGVETSGYDGSTTRSGSGVATIQDTVGMTVYVATTGSSESLCGVFSLRLANESTNTWIGTFSGGSSGSTSITFHSGFTKSLSGELTTVRVGSSAGAQTFVGGTLNVQYDNPEPVILKDSGRGIAVQTVHTQDGELASGTTTIPLNDTVPQNNEGTEFMTCSITPKAVGNKLKIEVLINLLTNTTDEQLQVALFQDSTADALASTVGNWIDVSGEAQCIALTHWMTAGTESSTTFKVRAGGHGSGTYYMNGYSGGRLHGGVMASSITITEYKA